VVAIVVNVAYYYFGNKDIAIDSLPASILGVAIAFLIGFRVNSAYDRWWEARKLWGALVNDSRTVARQIQTFVKKPGSEAHVKKFIYRQIAFVYALKNALRKKEIMDEIKPFLDAEEWQTLQDQKNIPNAILLNHGKHLEQLRGEKLLDEFPHMQLDIKLSNLCDSMGGCERIKNTIFPRQYSFYSTFFVKLYTFALPFTLVGESGWVSIPSTVIIGFIFYALDNIATGIENPFENTNNDTPMSSICRTIEINLRQTLGEKELPPPVEPVNGFLF
jgi:putative membrane protein